MWRNGPNGQKTLCNACGVRMQRAQHKARQKAHNSGAEGSSEDQNSQLQDSQPLAASSPRRHSQPLHKGRTSRSLGSAAEFAEARPGKLQQPPYVDAVARLGQGSLSAAAQQKRKPREATQVPSSPALIRKRSCVRTAPVEAPGDHAPASDVLVSVEGLDMVVSGGMGTGTNYTCIRPVRAVLSKLLQTRVAVPGRGQSPYVLSILGKDGRLLALARAAQSALSRAQYSADVQTFLWNSQCGWLLAGIGGDKYTLFEGALSFSPA